MRAQAYDDRNVMDIPVEWAFGAGGQAVTFVTRIDKDWYLEHFYSYYSAIDRMAPTAGQHVLQPRTLPEAMGLIRRWIRAPASLDTSVIVTPGRIDAISA